MHVLWVHAEHRKKGYGAALMERAETMARERGCDVSILSTFSFQAPAFYTRLGYRVFGEINNLPHGHRRVWLTKPLLMSLFTVTAAQPEKTESGIPWRVIYTIEDSAPNYGADNVRVAVIAFVYTDRLGGFAVVFDRTKAFASGRRAVGAVNLNLPPLPDPSSKWKLAVMPTEGFFDGHQWLLPGGKAGGVASAALYGARQ